MKTTCSNCGIELTAENAYPSRKAKSGFQCRCKKCDAIKARERNNPTRRRDFGVSDAAGVGRRLPRVEGDTCQGCGLKRGEAA